MGCNPMPGIVDFWDFGIWGGWTPLIPDAICQMINEKKPCCLGYKAEYIT